MLFRSSLRLDLLQPRLHLVLSIVELIAGQTFALAEHDSVNNKIKTFDDINTDTENNFNLNEVKEDSKNIENFDNSREVSNEVKDKYIFNQEDAGRGKIFDDFTSLKNIDFKVIGQVFDTFILVERNGLLEIYDQHRRQIGRASCRERV